MARSLSQFVDFVDHLVQSDKNVIFLIARPLKIGLAYHIWVVLFDLSFLGPLLQHSHWIDHLLWESLFSKFGQNHPSIEASVAHHTSDWMSLA